ncbi:lipoprotein LpqV [Mycolicibacterium sp.]|uniref:lipoprotein LpqV n=1 Tax=Mycolicibacterium sp. TaxID=2320850 RepID=UPI0028AF7DAB|nr:lipoprotein LpqV [Mycolicibacterium sp.]
MLSSRLSTRHRVQFGAAVIGSAVLLLTGCSSRTDEKATPAAPAPSSEPQAATPGGPAIGISPGGVTTRIDEPAQSTEEQYGQSCLAAKDLLTAKGGDPRDHVESLLQDVQKSADASPVTFRKTWAELSTAQQAAVIIAVQAAADGGC